MSFIMVVYFLKIANKIISLNFQKMIINLKFCLKFNININIYIHINMFTCKAKLL